MSLGELPHRRGVMRFVGALPQVDTVLGNKVHYSDNTKSDADRLMGGGCLGGDPTPRGLSELKLRFGEIGVQGADRGYWTSGARN